MARRRSAAQLARTVGRRVGDERVLDAIASVPRELFVPSDLADEAYADEALPIAGAQTISQPTVVALMCEALAPGPEDRVLDVGTGSGYHAAVLARLAAHVWGVERDPQLADGAARALEAAGVANVTVTAGDGRLGLPDLAPFDVVNVAATANGSIPAALTDQLAAGGRLVAPVAWTGGEHLVLVRRTADGLVRRRLGPVRFVPLR